MLPLAGCHSPTQVRVRRGRFGPGGWRLPCSRSRGIRMLCATGTWNWAPTSHVYAAACCLACCPTWCQHHPEATCECAAVDVALETSMCSRQAMPTFSYSGIIQPRAHTATHPPTTGSGRGPAWHRVEAPRRLSHNRCRQHACCSCTQSNQGAAGEHACPTRKHAGDRTAELRKHDHTKPNPPSRRRKVLWLGMAVRWDTSDKNNRGTITTSTIASIKLA